MSHVVSIKTQLKDAAALSAACRRLKLAEPVRETVELFSGQATGLAVRLPNWQYPVVVDVAEGVVSLDNYDGHWGDIKEYERLVQMYAVEKTKIEARRRGHMVNETALEDGSIKLQICEGV